MVFNQLSSQWANPSDLLSFLLLIGGDVVRHALAQQTGHNWPTPVVFSFGWVAYSFIGLLSAVGDNKLLPAPDVPSVVVDITSGYARTNQSWIIGRIIRDFEQYWMDGNVQTKLNNMLAKEKRKKKGLCITVYKVSNNARAGVPHRDLYWISGYIVAFVQLGIAGIPGAIWGEWDTLAITFIGTVLAFVTGSLPQWRHERWACRKNSRANYVLTRGNGSQHVLAILGNGSSLDLAELASAGEGMSDEPVTRWIYAFLAVCWVVLLISVTGVKQHTWFLLGVGSLGMLHTFIVAGCGRQPAAFGLHLEFVKAFVHPKVMECLMEAQDDDRLGYPHMDCPNLGWSLVSTFFPGEISAQEKVYWDARKAIATEGEALIKARNKAAEVEKKARKVLADARMQAMNGETAAKAAARLPAAGGTWARQQAEEARLQAHEASTQAHVASTQAEEAIRAAGVATTAADRAAATDSIAIATDIRREVETAETTAKAALTQAETALGQAKAAIVLASAALIEASR